MSGGHTNAIPTPLNDLLVKLTFLSKLQQGNKVNITSMSFVDATSWLGAFQRSLAGEGRKDLMMHLKQIIEQTILNIQDYQDTEFCAIIVNHLAEAKIGIQTLSSTYSDDPQIVSQIQVMLQNIDLQLSKNKNLLAGRQTVQPETVTQTIVSPENKTSLVYQQS